MILSRYKICSNYIMTALWVGYCYKYYYVDFKLDLLITKVQSKLPSKKKWLVVSAKSDGTPTLWKEDWYHQNQPTISSITPPTFSMHVCIFLRPPDNVCFNHWKTKNTSTRESHSEAVQFHTGLSAFPSNWVQVSQMYGIWVWLISLWDVYY